MAAPKAKKIEGAPNGASVEKVSGSEQLEPTGSEQLEPQADLDTQEPGAPDPEENSESEDKEASGPVETTEPKDSGVRMVKVHNLKGTYFVQPSTGLRISGHEVKLMADDSWLQLQIRAGLLAKV